jgi:protein O-GlcNAc transferase
LLKRGDLFKTSEVSLNTPSDLQSLFARALQRQHRGEPDAAIALYQDILTAAPSNVTVLNNLAGVLYAQGRFQEALDRYEQAMAAMPENPDLILNRAFALRELRQMEEAIATCEWVVAHWPDRADAWTVLGGLLQQTLRFPEARDSYNHALALQPFNAEALNNLGVVYCELGAYQQALNNLDRAVEIAPGNWHAHNNRGIALRNLLRFDDALACYRRAQALNPEYAQAFYNEGDVCLNLQRYENAAAAYGRAASLAPDLPNVQGAQLYARMRLCDWTDFDDRSAAILAGVDRGAPVTSPFTLLLLPSSPIQQLKAAQICIERQFARAPMAGQVLHDNSRIRVAYVSATFRNHPSMQLAGDVFTLHDRRLFDIYAYSLGGHDGSDTRTRIEGSFDHFIDAQSMDDFSVAKLIQEHQIDIAVDLDGFIEGSRTGVLALRPAPAQISWLGYPGTMGASHMDYIIADAKVVPPGAEAGFGECILRLPFSYQPNSRRPVAGAASLRTEIGLPEGGFVFCCFNNPYKITPDVFAVWMHLLTAVPDSVLWLLGDNMTAQQNLARAAEQYGVARGRVIFTPRADQPAYLAHLMAADLFLDTFHYNAHTTASDALWAGLPLVTKAGQTFASRVAASLLHSVGLPELVTNSVEEYERLILKLVRERDVLAAMRRKLVESRSTAPLFDIAQFTRDLENAFMSIVPPERRQFLAG